MEAFDVAWICTTGLTRPLEHGDDDNARGEGFLLRERDMWLSRLTRDMGAESRRQAGEPGMSQFRGGMLLASVAREGELCRRARQAALLMDISVPCIPVRV